MKQRHDINGNVSPRTGDVLKQARQEIAAEDFRADIDAAKHRIREAQAAGKWWHRFIPFTVKIERRS